ncbi:phosphatidylinositol-glycan biosynthesis class f protein-related [Holotrichia oblita]|uniref:Phosphatidylinositol-glycan biosynthesis class f protein-related n=1 Tax=Holotrichia oblita TaxID=644536 RepID=A0ACB9T658_HOLOL|nr:phosphatidylinositol-glycan biosynthesis class f protein-related [Holotrichia oblita]
MSCCNCLSIFFSIIAFAAIALKIYVKLTTKWNNSYTTLVGKTAIITGEINRNYLTELGIGYYTALDFAKRGARVILACRNRDRAEDALRRIIKATNNKNVTYKLVDLKSLQSVRDFAADINKNEERVDILVNNADKLKKSAPSRIVNVSSMAAKNAALSVKTVDKMNEILKDYFDLAMYNNSKLCNILFTTELAKRLSETGVTVNVLHPGIIATNFLSNAQGLMKIVFQFMVNWFFLTSEEGAQTQIYLSVSNDVANVTGGLFDKCKQVDIYETAQDVDLAVKVWKKSEEYAKLNDNEKIAYLLHEMVDDDQMDLAIKNVLDGCLTIKGAAAHFNIPSSTLKDRIRLVETQQAQGKSIQFSSSGHLTVFNRDQEKDFAERIKDLSSRS